MILQDLIRNYVLYRGVLKPLLVSWKEALSAGYQREIVGGTSFLPFLALNRRESLGDGEEMGWDISDEYDLSLLAKISGTRTITDYIKHSMRGFEVFYQRGASLGASLSGNSECIVLRGSMIEDNAVSITKTSSQTSISTEDFGDSATSHTINKTTGYDKQQINSFLFETHEKREYLGEFSLTHEETPLLYQLGGGEYHDIY